ncbi:MAG: hypothetical protein V5A47_04950, partial [Bacteroidales bacterium]
MTYSYNDDNPSAMAIRLIDGNGAAARFDFDDSAYNGGNSEKTVTLSLSQPDSGGVDAGTTYDIELTATDGDGNSSTVSGTDLLTID